MTPEQYLDKQIMIWCGERNWLCFHCNVGKVRTDDGRIFSTGLPTGFPDLLIITDTGKVIFCETKIRPRKATAEQKNFINNLINRGHIAFVSYSIDEFILQIQKYFLNHEKCPILG